MSTLDGTPYLVIQFDENNNLVKPKIKDEIWNFAKTNGLDDIVVISHGWRNSAKDAQTFYGALWKNIQAKLGSLTKTGVIGIEWHSMAYDESFEASLFVSDENSVAGAGASATTGDLTEEEFARRLADGLAAIDAGQWTASTTASIEAFIDNQSVTNARAVFEALTKAVPKTGDAELDGLIDTLRHLAESDDAAGILGGLGTPVAIPDTGGSVQGIFDGIGRVLAGPRVAVAKLLNFMGYWEMKRRAGVIGAKLAGEIFAKLSPARPLRLHLIGHSFGARVISALTNAMPDGAVVQIASMTLLQAAFSHNGYSKRPAPAESGVFTAVPGKVKGVIAVTHTHNDLACFRVYALASRLSNDVTAAFGDANDDYGAMGANGPQHYHGTLHPVTDIAKPGLKPTPAVNAIKADAFISDHGDVSNDKVGEFVANVIRAAAPGIG